MTRVLVARLDSMGDVLVTGPAVRAIAADPAVSELAFLCGPAGRPAAELLPGPTEVFTWESPWTVVPAPPVDEAHLDVLVQYLRRGFDRVVILTSFHQSPLPLALLAKLAGVPHVTGASVDFAGSLLDVRLRPGEDFPEDQPEAERALTIAEAAGFSLPAGDDGRLAITDPTGTFFPTGPDGAGTEDDGTRTEAGVLLARTLAEAPYVVLHPGASAPARTWPAENARDTVRALDSAGYRVVVTGSPAERELTRFVAGSRGIDAGGATDLRGTAEILARAEAVIVGNTGPAHLAAAVGTPVVSLFAPVVPLIRWAPYGVPLEILGDQHAPCRLSRARDCPVPGHPCLSQVTAAEVVDALGRLLERVRTGSAAVPDELLTPARSTTRAPRKGPS